VIGATSGIGAAFAEAFGKKGLDIVMTGRRQEKIEAVADAIRTKHGVGVEVILAELSDDGDLTSLVEELRTIGNLEILVNSAGAGFALNRNYWEQDLAVHETMLRVHNLAVMRLTHAALAIMIENGQGAIINVSSLSAFHPIPGNAMYSATKAFLRFFSESLHIELAGTGVKVQVLCPGFTRTDFHTRMGLDPEQVYKDKGLLKAMTPQEVVEVSLGYLEKNKPVCVPGLNYRFARAMFRVLPRGLVYNMVASTADQMSADTHREAA
jgi:short-subunit dehydrogenase